MVLVIEDTPMARDANSDDSDSDEQGADSEDDDDLDCPTPAVIRIASQAAVLLIDKYLDLLWECDIYIIAIGVLLIYSYICISQNLNIVMCPDRKTGWFKEHMKYPTTQIKKIKAIVIKAWKSKYASQDQPESSQVQKKDKSRKGKLVYFNF